MEETVCNGVESMLIGDQSDPFIDITDEFFNSTKTIEIGDVVKSKFFALFEGTRALEVMNKVLDTGLIPLTTEELKFDVSEPRNLTTVINISANLFYSVMTWLNTSSLPVTVLSCRYVEESLKNFDGSTLESCNFGLKKSEYENNVDFLLVHKVLLSIVRGLLIFIKNVLLLGQAGVLYEEEDITTTTMGFDFLSEVPNDLVEQDIEESIKWVEENIDNLEKRHLISFLKIWASFTQIGKLLDYEVNVFNEILPKEPIFLKSALQHLENIKIDYNYFESMPDSPTGCFSEGIQKRCDNFLPPRLRHMDSNKLSVDSAITMVQDLLNMLKVVSCKSITELTEFLDTFMNKRDPPSQVVSRALLQLFLVRDDRSVMGNPNKKFIGLLVDDMSSLTCYDSKVFSKFHQGDIPELNQELIELLNNIESAYYSYVLTISQNLCRQRQHFNRSILIWDTLQVQAETFEIAVQEKYKLNDCFKIGESSDEIPTMPISSWVYYQKLRSMLEVVLRGIELELYKQWELYSIYWYIEYLTSILTGHFERIVLTLEHKKLMISSIPKKIKKLKAGEKKQQLKETYKRKMEVDMPQLDHNIAILKSKISDTGVLKNLSELYKQFFSVLYELEMLKLPKLNKIPERLSYGLKMKSFQSVGVPDFPDYDRWCTVRRYLTGQLKEKQAKVALLDDIKSGCNIIKSNLIESRAKLEKDDDGFVNSERKLMYDQMIKSCIGLSVSVVMIMKQIREEYGESCFKEGKFEVMIVREGYHRYFPLFQIFKKK